MIRRSMTEAEAKQKICPFTLAGAIPEFEGGGRFPTGKLVHAPAMCQAARCMAWILEWPELMHQAAAEDRAKQPPHGFCARLVTP